MAPGVEMECKKLARVLYAPDNLDCILYSYVLVLNCVIQIYADQRSERFRTIPKKYNMTEEDEEKINTLPDLGFDWLPFLSNAAIADYVVIVLVIVTMVRFAPTPMGATIVRRWLFMLGSLFFLRGICIIITMLPNPLAECKIVTQNENPFVGGFKVLLGEIVTCSDVLYSGHTVNLTLCALMWNEFSSLPGALIVDWDPVCTLVAGGTPAVNEAGHRVRTTTAKAFVWLYTVFGYSMIIATHFHYTVDVFIGMCMAVLLWKFYHYYLPTMYIDDQKRINRLFVWLEKDSRRFTLDDEIGDVVRGKISVGDITNEV